MENNIIDNNINSGGWKGHSPSHSHFYYIKTIDAFTIGFFKRFLHAELIAFVITFGFKLEINKRHDLVQYWNRKISDLVPFFKPLDLNLELYWYNPLKVDFNKKIKDYVLYQLKNIFNAIAGLQGTAVPATPPLPHLLKLPWKTDFVNYFVLCCKTVCFQLFPDSDLSPLEETKEFKTLQNNPHILSIETWNNKNIQTIYSEVVSCLFPGKNYLQSFNINIKKYKYTTPIQQNIISYIIELQQWNEIVLNYWLNLFPGLLDQKLVLENTIMDSVKLNKEENKLLITNLKIKFDLTTPNSVIQMIHFSLLKIWKPIIKYFSDITKENTLPKGFQLMHEGCLQIIDLMISLLIHSHKKDKVLHFIYFDNYVPDVAESWLAKLIDKKLQGTAVPCNPDNNLPIKMEHTSSNNNNNDNNQESWKGDSLHNNIDRKKGLKRHNPSDNNNIQERWKGHSLSDDI